MDVKKEIKKQSYAALATAIAWFLNTCVCIYLDKWYSAGFAAVVTGICIYWYAFIIKTLRECTRILEEIDRLREEEIISSKKENATRTITIHK